MIMATKLPAVHPGEVLLEEFSATASTARARLTPAEPPAREA
jgi:hypothetical protein